MKMKLIYEGSEGELVMSGRLDTNTAIEAEKILTDVVGRFDKVVLNMRELEYVSSAGLRALRRAQVELRRKGGALTLKDVAPSVMELFEITGFAATCKFA